MVVLGVLAVSLKQGTPELSGMLVQGQRLACQVLIHDPCVASLHFHQQFDLHSKPARDPLQCKPLALRCPAFRLYPRRPPCEDRILDGPASGEKGSKCRNLLDCTLRGCTSHPRNTFSCTITRLEAGSCSSWEVYSRAWSTQGGLLVTP